MYDSKELVSHVINCVNKKEAFNKHDNLLIVGDNKSGKTTFLRLLLKEIVDKGQTDYYYIDAKNRSITDASENITEKRYKDYDVLELLRERTDKSVMTISDYFTDHDPGGLVTISELLERYIYYSELFSKIYNEKKELKVVKSEKEYKDQRDTLLETSIRSKLLINDQDIQSLCSSEASELRLIMEVNNAQEKECKVVVIDEADTHFDNRRMAEFLELIVSFFSDLRFIIVIHNADVIIDISNMDACIFNVTKDGKHKMIDANDIKEYGQIDRIKSKYMETVDDIDIILEQCVDFYVKNGNLSNELLEQYENIDKKSLNGRTLVWYRYIEKGLKKSEA